MKIYILAFLIIALPVPVMAMSDRTWTSTLLGLSTTNSRGITTPTGADIQRANINFVPSTIYGFSCERKLYVRCSEQVRASMVSSLVSAYALKGMKCEAIAFDLNWNVDRQKAELMKLGKNSIVITIVPDVLWGRETAQSSRSNSSNAYHSGWWDYVTANSSRCTSEERKAWVVVDAQYYVFMNQVEDAGAPNLPILPSAGGSDSVQTESYEHSSDSTSRSSSSDCGSSRHSSTSSYHESWHKDERLERGRLERKVGDQSCQAIAAYIVDAIATSALSGDIKDAIITAPNEKKAPTRSTRVRSGGGKIIDIYFE